MRNGIIALIVAVVLLFAVGGTYNGLVRADETVSQAYAQVQTVMQRQADLIPNLVATVKGQAGFESSTLAQITAARSQLSAVGRMNPQDLAKQPDLQKQLIDAQASMGKALVTLNAAREAYPNLQTNESFRALMVELEGSQNRIAVERRRSQQAVQDYNQKTRMFPTVFLARLLGFTPHPYFQASDAAQTTPTVQF